MRARWWATFVALGLALIGGGPVGTADAATPAPRATAPDPQISAVAQRLWSKLLTTCGASSFYVGSDLDGRDSIFLEETAIIEFRGLKFNAVPIRVSDAERLNGVTAHARITMTAHIYRVAGEEWRDGPDLVPRSITDQMNQSFRQVFEDDAELGKAGAMAFDLARIRGRWVFRRSSLIMSDNVSLDGNFDLEQFIAAPASHYVCQTGRATPRPPKPPTAEEIAAAKTAAEAAAKERAEEAKRQAEHAQREAELKAEHEESMAAFRQRQKVLDQTEKAWRYAGDAKGFHAALVANLARRGAEFGFDPNSYGREIAAIDDAVATCLRVTETEWRSEDASWRKSLSGGGPRYSMKEHLERLRGCDGYGAMVWGDSVSAPDRPHGLGIQRNMSRSNAAGDWFEPTPYLQFRVILKPVKDVDSARIGVIHADEIPSHFNVIDARIPFPGQALTPDLQAWVDGR